MLNAEVFMLWVSMHVKRKIWERQKAAVVPLDFWEIKLFLTNPPFLYTDIHKRLTLLQV